jgi:predicted small metal-binding protein
MSEDSPKGILVVNCACGLLMRGTVDELVPTVQKHALEAHNMRVTKEDVLAKARPES